jgi:hypothetical protein
MHHAAWPWRSGRAHGVHGVLLENVHVTIAAWTNYSAGGAPPCFDEAGDSFPCAKRNQPAPALRRHTAGTVHRTLHRVRRDVDRAVSVQACRATHSVGRAT